MPRSLARAFSSSMSGQGTAHGIFIGNIQADAIGLYRAAMVESPKKEMTDLHLHSLGRDPT